MIAAYGMSGVTDKAEATFSAMRAAGWTPRDYAYCGLIAAHSFKGDWQVCVCACACGCGWVGGVRARRRRLGVPLQRACRAPPPPPRHPLTLTQPPCAPPPPPPPLPLQSALRVKERMAAVGAAPTVHVYNAIIAACDRAHQYERALRVAKEMRDADVPGNGVTQSVRAGKRVAAGCQQQRRLHPAPAPLLLLPLRCCSPGCAPVSLNRVPAHRPPSQPRSCWMACARRACARWRASRPPLPHCRPPWPPPAPS